MNLNLEKVRFGLKMVVVVVVNFSYRKISQGKKI